MKRKVKTFPRNFLFIFFFNRKFTCFSIASKTRSLSCREIWCHPRFEFSSKFHISVDEEHLRRLVSDESLAIPKYQRFFDSGNLCTQVTPRVPDAFPELGTKDRSHWMVFILCTKSLTHCIGSSLRNTMECVGIGMVGICIIGVGDSFLLPTLWMINFLHLNSMENSGICFLYIPVNCKEWKISISCLQEKSCEFSRKFHFPSFRCSKTSWRICRASSVSSENSPNIRENQSHSFFNL